MSGERVPPAHQLIGSKGVVRQYCDVLGAALGRAGGIGDGHEGQAQALGAAAYERFVVEVAGHDAAGVGTTGRGGVISATATSISMRSSGLEQLSLEATSSSR